MLALELARELLRLHEAQRALLRLGGWFRVHSNFSSIFKKFDREGVLQILKKIQTRAQIEKVWILGRMELWISDAADIEFIIE